MNAEKVIKMRENKRNKESKENKLDNTSTTVNLNLTSTTKAKELSAEALQLFQLESKNAELSKQLNTIFSKVNALDSHIDWDNNRPIQKIKKFGLFTIANWAEILEIIKQLVKLARQYKANNGTIQ